MNAPQNNVSYYYSESYSSSNKVNGQDVQAPINYVEEITGERNLNDPSDPGKFSRRVYNPDGLSSNFRTSFPNTHQPFMFNPMGRGQQMPTPFAKSALALPMRGFSQQQKGPVRNRQLQAQAMQHQQQVAQQHQAFASQAQQMAGGNASAPFAQGVGNSFQNNQINQFMNQFDFYNFANQSVRDRRKNLLLLGKDTKLDDLLFRLNMYGQQAAAMQPSNRAMPYIVSDVEYLREKLKQLRGNSFSGFDTSQQSLFLPYEMTRTVNGKPLRFQFGGERPPCDLVKNIQCDLVLNDKLADFCNTCNPADIVKMYYDGQLKGVAIINYYSNHASLEGFSACKGFRTPFINFLKSNVVPRHNRVGSYRIVVPDKYNDAFWSKYRREISSCGYPVL